MPDGWLINRYNYRVVRLWGEDPEPYLVAGVNLVPLAPVAPLANVTVEELPGLVARMSVRINSELRPRSLKLWTATYLLMGLCYSEGRIGMSSGSRPWVSGSLSRMAETGRSCSGADRAMNARTAIE